MKRKGFSNTIYIAIIVFSISISILAAYVYNSIPIKTNIPSVDELIKEKQEINYQDKDQKQIDTNTYVNQLPKYRAEYNNQDILGILEIPNLNINTLVARTTNNEYYLNYSLYHQYDRLGIPFFDYRNTDLVNARQLNIYGHNSTNPKHRDYLPFINLEAYVDENIFKNYKDIYLSIDQTQKKYKIIAVKIIDNTNNEHMKVIFYSDEDYLRHVSKLLQNTLYKDSDIKIDAKTKLLVLQACHYNPPDTYILVIGKEVN